LIRQYLVGIASLCSDEGAYSQEIEALAGVHDGCFFLAECHLQFLANEVCQFSLESLGFLAITHHHDEIVSVTDISGEPDSSFPLALSPLVT